MIYASLSDAGNYLGIHPNLDRALKLLTPDFLSTVGTVRQSIDGDKLFVTSEFGTYTYDHETLKLDEEIPENESFDCVLGLRPEMVDIYTKDPGHKNTVAAKIYANQPAGSETLVTLTVGQTEFLAIQVGLVEYDMNQDVFVVLHPGRMNVYNKETGRLIKFAKTKHKAGIDD